MIFQKIARIIAIFAIILIAPQTFAQNVKMRTGVHADYSRLVIDWPTKVNSSLTKDAQTLNITFEKASNPSTQNVDVSKARNIENVKVTNTNPLAVSVVMPGNNRYRSFYAGNRFVLDIYNLPGTAPEKITAKLAPQPKPKVSAESIKTDNEVPKQPDAPKPLEEVVNAAKAVKVESVEVEELQEQQGQEQQKEAPEFAKLQNPGRGTANLIALSSSTAFGLAVFERDDKIFIVNDNPELLISPKVSGPDSRFLMPINTVDREDSKIFTAQSILGASVRTQGGGLVWKVIIADAKNKTPPKSPRRINVTEGEVRSGTLLIPFEEASQLITLKDPLTGRDIKVITSKTSKDFTGPAQKFPDFDILSSAAGLAIIPRVDDLEVKIKADGVVISRPNGLAILSQKRIEMAKAPKPKSIQDKEKSKNKKRIYDFNNWKLGGIDALNENQSILLSNAGQLPDTERDAAIMTLAKMYLANAMGAESLGFLKMLENFNPEIANTAEFRAIRGAANAIDFNSREAFNDIAIKDLEPFEDIGLWKAVALADIGDWKQAADVLPKSAALLYEYPILLSNRVAPVAAEVALRAGQTELATEYLTIVEDNFDTLNDQQIAAVNYLRGEKFRQMNQIEDTQEYWEPLVTGRDDLYRAKAGLALTRLQINEGKLAPKDAIDTLERLRYSWRGDELEAQIGYWLGRTYFEAKEYIKGLNLMREAATVAAGTSLGTRVTNEMTDIVTALYMDDTLDEVSPLDAVALYEQFTEILPGGDAGDRIVERLADRLTTADLLTRASKLLDYQLNHRLKGIDAYNVAIKLSAIQLLDEESSAALKTLETAQARYEELPENLQTPDKVQNLRLLRARALSRNGRPDQAIELLEGMDKNATTNRLRADIAWTAGYWDDAASALGDVIIDQNISLTRPLSDENTTLILHRAISLNLASDRIALANMREKYTDAMAQTDKSRIFEVITRPRQSAALADRDTLLDIVSEVDLFSDFLESYRTVSSPTN